MRRAAAIATLALVLFAPRVGAQGTARSMDIDPSVISAGMAGASTAVWWNGEPSVWANPALLGYHQGIRWQWGETQLVPGLASDVRFSVTRLTVAGAGIGVENAGDPSDAGGLELEYGESEGTDVNGNPTGTFSSFESIDATGVGVSVGRLVRAIAAARDADPPGIFEHFDLALGWARKHTLVALAPVAAFGQASAASSDLGLLFRVGGASDPLDLGNGAILSGNLGYAYSVINADDARFVFINEDQASPPTRQNRHGFALRIALEQGGTFADEEGFGALLVSGLDPWLAVGFAYDRVHATAGGLDEGFHQDLTGVEVTFANVLSLRSGRVGDRLGGFHHGSWGIGVNVPIGDLAGFRYDYANYPQPFLDDDLHRRSYAVWLDPFAVSRAIRE